ncbi:MAG: flagellar hook-basal body protein [Firmicutes bacterium]|nr:flagellar hook-basal body protein [Bacillota bacterium]MDD3297969.1 flagellar hook-basal body protein [Bacillota bacterium]MDD3850755.1 flagellar hook-basal body protein [Bacillota bacterium]MDD4707747.1 flagellar hook-basal body protein [Bacillota bacterium]
MAAGAMATEVKRVDVIANNIANADTNGYKGDRVITGPFREVLISIINDKDPDRGLVPQGGLSAAAEGGRIRLETRGRFLVLDTPRGKSYSTEAALTVNDEGYLVTTSGNYVLGAKGRIQAGDIQSLYLDQSGGVYSNGYLVDRLQLFSAPGVIGTLNGGSALNSVNTFFMQGNLRETDRHLDLAIKGEGFFCVRVQGEERYTRDGSFVVDTEGYLSTVEGFRVAGDMGDIYVGDEYIDIRTNGEMYSGELFWDRLKLVTFDRLEELRKVGDNLYTAGGDNAYRYGIEGEVLQGFLETSNINAVKEMVNMITAFRTYEANQRVVTAYDEVLGKAVNEVGRV